MDSELFEGVFTGVGLPLPSLRLLVPPLQLMTASMWQMMRQQDVMHYWTLAEFTSLVMEMIPELLMYKYRTQLNLGLRARYILELCRNEPPLDPGFISSHLDRIKPPTRTPGDENEIDVEAVGASFIELVQTFLKDPDEKEHFFTEVFSAEYGPQYDADLQTLFWEFLCRLAQLLPIPDLEQTVSWLGNTPSVLEDCVHPVSEPKDLKSLLQHHKHLGHLEQHVPPSSVGDCILSSLSVAPRGGASAKQADLCDDDDTGAISFVDEVEVEVVTVTDYTEVVLGPSSDAEDRGEGAGVEAASEEPPKTLSGEPVETLRDEETRGAEADEEAEEEETGRERHESGSTALVGPGEAQDDQGSDQHRASAGPHGCPDCDKSFRFASTLTAHRVIHMGERPHRCGACGRCFCSRRSLDRHKHTHKSGQTFDCVLCGEAFRSASACTEHKQRRHTTDGVFSRAQCDRTFAWESGLAKHLKAHADGRAGVDLDEFVEDVKEEREVAAMGENADVVVVACPESVSQPPELGGDGCNHNSGGGEGQTNRHPSTEPRVLAPKLLDEVISLVQVRTSGRKRKPAMKIQVMNLQKSIVKVPAPRSRQRGTTATPPDTKPVPFNSAEHSYGSPLVPSKEGDDGSPQTFTCPQCSFSHADEAQVRQHITRAHPGDSEGDQPPAQPLTDQDGRFGCPDCEKSFKFQSLLKAHQRIHTGERPYACSQCGRCFSFKQSLERHKHTHKDGRKYECLICGEFFKSLAAHREHKSSHMENGEYLCSKCGRAFAWKSALVRHLKTHGEDGDKTEHLYKCSHCDLSFSCVTYLNRHLLTHKEERLHVCMCGKSFAYKAALTAHQRTHQKERPHQCKLCGKGFLYKGGLQSHMKIHSEDMPFMCSFCGKSFKRERNMKKHEHCHTRENVFSCSQCDKSFVYKATLVRHELTHSGERPFLCADCGKGFFSHAELLKHERFHTGHKPFQCSHCGKRFTQSCYLTIHLRYHTGVRPYSCTECDKSFLSANRLKRHQRTHTGEKPYLCVECGKGFKQSYHLKMHQRTHNT